LVKEVAGIAEDSNILTFPASAALLSVDCYSSKCVGWYLLCNALSASPNVLKSKSVSLRNAAFRESLFVNESVPVV